VSFEIQPGECVALVGPNGAGKSTLFQHLNGLLPGKAGSSHGHHHHGPALPRLNGKASSPSIWVDGLAVEPKSLVRVRRKVGLLFQDPDDQLFCPSVIEDVAFGPLNLGKSKDEARRIAIDCLGRVDLADAIDRVPHHLSFGERKRVCLAGVLACDPSVLVLDEPTANLDPRARRRFIALIEGLPVTRLIATHDLEMALEICPRTLLLNRGQVVADGPSREILGDETLMESNGLELPLSLAIERRR
jgi:energy-coupling factor transporter ATP-binding protein EcfA2